MFSSLQSELSHSGSVQFYVRVRPGMPVTKAVNFLDDESIKIDIAAPAEGGKANAVLTAYLASVFSVPKDHVRIVSGTTARTKLIRIIH